MKQETFTTTLVSSDAELQQILELQKNNRAFTNDGFVTVQHNLNLLQRFHETMPSIIAKHNDQVVAYALSMPVQAQAFVPILEPMFQRLAKLEMLQNKRWYVMGQVCVDQVWRGRGVFDALYAQHLQSYRDQFDCLVTEISYRNPRSMNAHRRVGFVEIDRHQDESDDWSVVAWSFR